MPTDPPGGRQEPTWHSRSTCPSNQCRGQFLWLRNVGIICSRRLAEHPKLVDLGILEPKVLRTSDLRDEGVGL